jgi:Tol biopolymer transport system component
MAFDGLLVDPARPQIYIQSIDEADCKLVDNRLEIANGYVTDPNGLYPLWGPDGNVYFRSCATWDPLGASTCGIWSVQEDGSGARQLTDNPNHLPNDVNREQLIFMSSHQGNWELYSVSVRGGVPKNLTKHPGNDAWGTLSPDGRAIAFLSDRSGQWSIWLANVDGSNPQEWLPINADWGEIDPDRMAQERMSWSK